MFAEEADAEFFSKEFAGERNASFREKKAKNWSQWRKGTSALRQS